MTLVTTTLVNPVGANDLIILLASVANFSASLPGNLAALGTFPLLLVDQELMRVLSMGVTVAAGSYVNVQRGVEGTAAIPHGASIPATSGFQADFTGFMASLNIGFVPANRSSGALSFPWQGVGAPVLGAATNIASSGLFHLTGTTAMVNLTAPTGYVEGGSGITIIFDGSAAGLTWTAAGNISAAGTATTAGTAVTFTYDLSIAKWVPSRVS